MLSTPILKELPMFQVASLFYARIVGSVLAILLKLDCPSQNFSFWFLGIMCVTITNMWIVHRTLAQHVGSQDLNFCSSWFRAVYPALPGGIHGFEYGFPVLNHATRQVYPARAQVYVNILICMLLLWYSSVQRVQLGITVMIKFHLIKSTLFMSLCINSK